jgi:hypothetical protein
VGDENRPAELPPVSITVTLTAMTPSKGIALIHAQLPYRLCPLYDVNPSPWIVTLIPFDIPPIGCPFEVTTAE